MGQGDLVRPQRPKIHLARRLAVFQSRASQVIRVELAHRDVESLGRRDLVLLAWLGDEGGIGSNVLAHGRTEANNVLVLSSLVSIDARSSCTREYRKTGGLGRGGRGLVTYCA